MNAVENIFTRECLSCLCRPQFFLLIYFTAYTMVFLLREKKISYDSVSVSIYQVLPVLLLWAACRCNQRHVSYRVH
ncbi:hypothetical protein F5Y14DRAFT_90786 [Nemania sp. NC0429]|nr:hypothetical protein F5Y14DRAFT_90786 [Nemania sp. NC0429]